MPDKQRDPIPTWLLKVCDGELVPFLSQLFNAWLAMGSVPATFKSAFIMLLLKTQGLDAVVVKNYRPISNLLVISKLLEYIVVHQLVTYLIEHNLLPSR